MRGKVQDDVVRRWLRLVGVGWSGTLVIAVVQVHVQVVNVVGWCAAYHASLFLSAREVNSC